MEDLRLQTENDKQNLKKQITSNKRCAEFNSMFIYKTTKTKTNV